MSSYLADAEPLHEGTLPGGHHWSLLMRGGKVLRLIDTEGGANVGMLFYNPADKAERYNAPDTLKCQHTFKITRGHCLYSDMGRIFCSVVEDTLGWHDTIGGYLTDAALREKWGHVSYQAKRNDWQISGEHAFLVELAKHGMNRRDLAANLNWFSCVSVDDEGNIRLVPGHSRPGSYVDLRFEMDTLVLMHSCPHPLNQAESYPRAPVTYRIFSAKPVAEDDLCRNASPENRRGFVNNVIFHQEAAG
jgi:urea carboxylase-associated protein 2